MDRSIIAMGIIFMLTWPNTVYAQDQKSLPEVDRLTYVLYQQKNWDGLIAEGNKALGQGMDYYYLRVRLGIAYYEKQNYHLASRHFDKALEMNDAEDYVKEYLYYAYLFSGRQADAKALASNFPYSLRRKTDTDQWQFIEGIDLAYNYTGISDPAFLDNFTADVPLDRDGAQFIPRQHHYFFLGMKHHLSPRLSFYHGYSNLQVSHLRYIQASNEASTESDFPSRLNQYYAAANLLIAKGLTLSGGIHFINSSYDAITQVVIGSPGRPTIRSVASRVNNNDLVAFASLYKSFDFITLGASYYRGTVADFIQNQTDLRLILYPFGNLNLYTTTTASYQNQDFRDGNIINRTIIDQQVGAKVSNWLWAEAYGTFGELDNFFLKDGLVVFNRMDLIKERFGGRLIILPTPKWSLTLDYTYMNNQSQFIQVPFTGEDFNQKNYQIHSITAISSWKF
jgi:tetratricopeptide (TPR) repeat protein